MENSLPNYLIQRGIKNTSKQDVLTDEEHEMLRTMNTDSAAIKLKNGDWVCAVPCNTNSKSIPCDSCCFKSECISGKGEDKRNPPLYMRMCLPHKRVDGKSVKFVKVKQP